MEPRSQQEDIYIVNNFTSHNWFYTPPGSSFNKSKSRYLALFLFILVITYIIPGKAWGLTPSTNSQFKVYNADNGLNVGAVEAIYQDHEGFMWFGGQDGLVRYDGYSFEKYVHDESQEGSLSHQRVWVMLEDEQQRLWIGTDAGLNLYDREQNRFRHFTSDLPKGNSIRAIAIDSAGTMWLGTANGLAQFHLPTETFTFFEHLEIIIDQPASETLVNFLEFDHQGELWLATSGGGLTRYNPQTEAIRRYTTNNNDPHLTKLNVALAVKETQDHNIWVGTDLGLSMLNRATQSFTHYEYAKDNPNALSGSTVTDILEDDDGNLWIATNAGLNYLNRQTNSFIQMHQDPQNPRSLGGEVIMSLFEDHNNDLWIGTFPQGVSFFNRSDMVFQTIHHSPDDKGGLNVPSILSFAEDRHGRLWVGTDGGGINLFDPDKRNARYYGPDLSRPYHSEFITGNAILDIIEDSDGSIWAGTWGAGLNRLYPETGKISHYLPDATQENALKSANIWVLFIDSKQRLWVGTIGGGLYRFNRQEQNFIPFFHEAGNPNSVSSNIIWTIHEDSQGDFWFGTDEGLDRYNEASHTFTHFQYNKSDLNSISGNIVLSIHEDADGILWIGTRGTGLNRLDPQTGNFTRYSKKNGLINDSVVSIEAGLNGNLWLSTHGGLSHFSPATGTFRNYDKSNGLQGNQFNINTSIKLKSGELIFGGTNGYTKFDPALVQANSYAPPVVFREFLLSNETVPIGSENSPLHKTINNTDSITLTHNQPVMTFTFSALSYRNPEKNQYAYMLEGFDKKWNRVGNKRSATYTNLDAGHYRFLVKAANNEGLWSDQPKTIALRILPPPWRTWWAYFLYALWVIGVIGWAFYAQRKKRQFVEKQNRILEERVNARTAELKKKNQDIQAMLSNMRQGLFTVEENGYIHPEYSRYLESIFETDKIAGQPAIPLLFGNAILDANTVDETKEACNAIIGEDEINFSFNEHLLVKEYEAVLGEKNKTLSLDWNPICENSIVIKLMVSVRDVTELKRMEKESTIQKRELAFIGQLVKIPHNKFRHFTTTVRQLIEDSRQCIHTSDLSQADKLDYLFRNMHTIKGNSRTYNFSFLSDIAHKIETVYVELKSADTHEWETTALREGLDTVEEVLNDYIHIHKDVFTGEAMDQTDTLHRDNDNTDTLENLLADIISSLPGIADQLNKSNPVVSFVRSNVRIDNSLFALITNVFTHILRNCLDHGLEAPHERIAAGKKVTGRITIEPKLRSDKIDIHIYDDGRGLNLVHLFQIGVQRGIWKEKDRPEATDIAHIIFDSGVSTAEYVTDISGRGVGMDAARQYLRENGGSIAIRFLEDPCISRTSIPFAIVVTTPLALSPSIISQADRPVMAKH